MSPAHPRLPADSGAEGVEAASRGGIAWCRDKNMKQAEQEDRILRPMWMWICWQQKKMRSLFFLLERQRLNCLATGREILSLECKWFNRLTTKKGGYPTTTTNWVANVDLKKGLNMSQPQKTELIENNSYGGIAANNTHFSVDLPVTKTGGVRRARSSG